MNLSELLGQRIVGHDDERCGISNLLSQQKELLSALPGESATDKDLMTWALQSLAEVATEATKEGRKQELQLELRMLDAPAGLDFESEDLSHTKLHIDADQMSIEIQKRQGAAWRRFIALVKDLGTG